MDTLPVSVILKFHSIFEKEYDFLSLLYINSTFITLKFKKKVKHTKDLIGNAPFYKNSNINGTLESTIETARDVK